MKAVPLRVFATLAIIIAIKALKFPTDDYLHICSNIFNDSYLKSTKESLDDVIKSITKNADQRSTWDKIISMPVVLDPKSQQLLDLLNHKKPFFYLVADQGWISSEQADQYIDEIKSVYNALDSCAQQGEEWSPSCKTYVDHFQMNEEKVVEEINRLKKKLYIDPKNDFRSQVKIDDLKSPKIYDLDHEEPTISPKKPVERIDSQDEFNDDAEESLKVDQLTDSQGSSMVKKAFFTKFIPYPNPKIKRGLTKHQDPLHGDKYEAMIIKLHDNDNQKQFDVEIKVKNDAVETEDKDVGLVNRFVGFVKNIFWKDKDIISPLNYGIANTIGPRNDVLQQRVEPINEDPLEDVEHDNDTEKTRKSEDEWLELSMPTIDDQPVEKKRKRRRVIVLVENVNCMYCYKDNLLINFIQQKYFIQHKF